MRSSRPFDEMSTHTQYVLYIPNVRFRLGLQCTEAVRHILLNISTGPDVVETIVTS